jgi:hypothetical protein
MDLHQTAHQGESVNFSLRGSQSLTVFIFQVLLPTAVGAAMVKYRKLDQDGLKAAAHIQIYGALPVSMP